MSNLDTIFLVVHDLAVSQGIIQIKDHMQVTILHLSLTLNPVLKNVNFQNLNYLAYPNEDPSAKVRAIAIIPIKRTDLYIARTHWILVVCHSVRYLFESYRGQFYDHCFMATSWRMCISEDEWVFVEVTEQWKYLNVCYDCSWNYSNVTDPWTLTLLFVWNITQ